MKHFTLYALLFTVLLSGCASDRAYQSYSSAYEAYAKSGQSANQSKACEINTVKDTTIPAGFNLVCYQGSSQQNIAPPQQIKDSEWAGPVGSIASSLLHAAAPAVTALVVANGAKDLAREVGQSAGTHAINSYNPNNAITDSQNPVAVVPPVTVIEPTIVPPVTIVETPVVVPPVVTTGTVTP